MKKLIILSSLLLLLASCGSTSTSTTATKEYSGTGFTMNIPSSWIEATSKDLPNIQNGNIALALTSAEISAGFANNLVVLKEALSKNTTSMDYFNTNYVRTTGLMKEFTKLSDDLVTFSDKDTSRIVTFEAKYSLQTPKRKFWQSTKVCGNTAYLITIGVNLDNAKTVYSDLIKSFACK